MKTFITLIMTAAFVVVAPRNVVFAHTSVSHFKSDPPEDSYYYEYSEVLFGAGVDAEGNMIDEATEFILPKTGPAKITVGVFNDEAFLTKEARVEIYNQDNELVDEFKLNLEPEWNWFKFVIELDKEGTYYVDIYNEIDVFINSGSVDVVKN
jgi:hypothetical protein